MRINQNIAAFNAYRNLNQTQNQLSSSLEKLSSGFRINRAADDASGLVNSENLRSQIGGLKVATRNAQDAISLVQTAEGAQTEVHSILQRMRDLTVQSGNLGTNDASALKANQDEINELNAELNRISDQTQFGTKPILAGATVEASEAIGTTATTGDAQLAAIRADTDFAVIDDKLTELEGDATAAAGDADAVAAAQKAINDYLGSVRAGDGTLADLAVATVDGTTGATTYAAGAETIDEGDAIFSGAPSSFTFQVGANAGQQVAVEVAASSSYGLNVDGIDVTTGESTDIDSALNAIDAAIGTVSENRATLGAFQNRMESTIRNVSVAVENLSAAESRIRDTDMADEMVTFTRNQILQQAGTAMLAQANQVPQSVLSLLR